MKKDLALLLAALMALSLLAGCAVQSGTKQETSDSSETAVTADDFKTLADIAGYESIGYTYDEERFATAFEADGVYYRVDANMTPEVYEALDELDFFDDEHDAKLAKIVSPLEITKVTNLTENIPTQAEMDALIGKTGQELLDEGWSNWGWNLDTLEYWMYHGPYAFTIAFTGDVEVTDDTDGDEILPGLVVKSVTYDGLGNATDLD